jgi:hypothetical protein
MFCRARNFRLKIRIFGGKSLKILPFLYIKFVFTLNKLEILCAL